jgi:hypothetical protein
LAVPRIEASNDPLAPVRRGFFLLDSGSRQLVLRRRVTSVRYLAAP